MLLSIAMIVKNEEANIERCLKALTLLKNKINYEIIIVDTGSKDNTINIANKYTNNIYEHKWNNDFSEMRNLSIKYCNGDWILILDADEVLENFTEIIEFFEGDEHKKYNSASVILKNLTSKNEDDFLIGSLIRLFRNSKDFFYTGRVHEQPNIMNPIGATSITFKHYGYSKEDYKLMKYKYERNKELLLKDLEQGKNLIYTYFQLAQTHSMANNKLEALNAIKKSFALVKKNGKAENYLYVYHFYSTELLINGNYNKVIEICEEAIRYSTKHMDFYFMLTKAYNALNNYEKSNIYFDKYIKLYNEFKVGKIVDDISVTNFSFCKKDDLLKDKILIYYNNKKLNEIITIFRNLTKETDKNQLSEIYLYSLVELDMFKQIFEYYSEKKISDHDIESLIRIIEKVSYDKLNNDIKEIGLKLLGLDDRLDLYIKSIYLDEEMTNNILNFDSKIFYKWKGDLFKKYLILDNNILEKLIVLEKQEMYKYVDYISGNYEGLDILYNYSKKKFMTNDIHTLLLVINIEEILIINDSISNNKYQSLVIRTYINKLNYINKIYNKEILNDSSLNNILGRYENIWIELRNCLKLNEKDKLLYIKGLREILKQVPEYKRLVQFYLNEVESENLNNEIINSREYFYNTALSNIEQNNINDALEILVHLNKWFKYDTEILNCLGIVLYLRGDYEEAIMKFALSNTLKENDFDTIYNLACVLEANDNLEEASDYYKIAYNLCEDENLKLEIKKIIAILNK
ncbi:glycosyltransferase [Clostridium botulinum]|nr:glycosyltransferase [Clostridium botulinum]